MSLSKLQLVGICLSFVWAAWAGFHQHTEDTTRAESSAKFSYKVCADTKQMTHDTDMSTCIQKQQDMRMLMLEGSNANAAFFALAPIPFAWLAVFILIYVGRAIKVGFRTVVPWGSLNGWKKTFVFFCGGFSGLVVIMGLIWVMNLYVDRQVPVVIGNLMVLPTGTDLLRVTGTWTRSGINEGSSIAYPLQTSQIDCNRQTGRCTEARAFVSDNVLMTDLVEYEVVSWTNAHVVFKNEYPCVIEEYTVDLKSNSVSGAGRLINEDENYCFGAKSNPEKAWTYQLVDGFKVYWEKRQRARPMPLRVIQAFFGN